MHKGNLIPEYTEAIFGLEGCWGLEDYRNVVHAALILDVPQVPVFEHCWREKKVPVFVLIPHIAGVVILGG